MPTTIIRTVLLYLLIVAAMKIMGKRQIGQMQLSELVTVTMLSELASYSILDTDIPLAYSVIPVFVLISIEVSISYFSVKSRFISRLFDGKPSFIIYKGELNQKELASSRLTLTEVISEIRTAGYNSISEIYYMILEPGGKVSVIPKSYRQPVTPSDMNIDITECGIDHALIIDGKLVRGVPEGFIDKNDVRLKKILDSYNVNDISQVFYLAVDDNGRSTFIEKENK